MAIMKNKTPFILSILAACLYLMQIIFFIYAYFMMRNARGLNFFSMFQNYIILIPLAIIGFLISIFLIAKDKKRPAGILLIISSIGGFVVSSWLGIFGSILGIIAGIKCFESNKKPKEKFKGFFL